MTIEETHEPNEPINWPDGHVSVVREPQGATSPERVKLAQISVSMTELDEDECIVVGLADHRHFLHSTTARALSDKLATQNGRAVEITIHGVRHRLGEKATKAFQQVLQRRLAEWNKKNSGSKGWSEV
jgi:hypothetical protein